MAIQSSLHLRLMAAIKWGKLISSSSSTWILIKAFTFHHLIACTQSIVKCSQFDLCLTPLMLSCIPFSPSTISDPSHYNSHDEWPRFIARGNLNCRPMITNTHSLHLSENGESQLHREIARSKFHHLHINYLVLHWKNNKNTCTKVKWH